jgi:hypothetical protein
LDDLDTIVKIMREALPGDLTIKVDDKLNADDVSDIATGYNAERLSSFSVRSFRPRVSLNLYKSFATLTLGNPTMEIKVMAAELEKYTKSRKRRIYSARRLLGIIFGLIALTGGIASAIRNQSLDGASASVGLFGGWALAAFSLILIAISAAISGGSGAILIAAKKKDAPMWLKRNKDGLTTNVIVSVVFYFLGLLTPVIVKSISALFR